MSDFKTFDLDIWSEPDEKHRVTHIGMKNCKEIFSILENHLKENGLLPDEYFLCDFRNFEDDCPLPDYDEAICHTNFGSSEGIYIDIFLRHYEDDKIKYVRFATGKTLGETADDFLKMSRIAAECSMLLNGRGRTLQKSTVAELMLDNEETETVTNALYQLKTFNEDCNRSCETICSLLDTFDFYEHINNTVPENQDEDEMEV